MRREDEYFLLVVSTCSIPLLDNLLAGTFYQILGVDKFLFQNTSVSSQRESSTLPKCFDNNVHAKNQTSCHQSLTK